MTKCHVVAVAVLKTMTMRLLLLVQLTIYISFRAATSRLRAAFSHRCQLI